MPANLPATSTEAAQHSARLCEFIRHDLASRGGWMSFARYMELALYAPGLGYYTAGAHKLGSAGDFTTAPELSALFGHTLARQVTEIMARSAPHILELGAGSGKLAVDILEELERNDNLPHSYAILEVSADLRERQRNMLGMRIPHLLHLIHWLEALPEKFSGVVLANEVLDALPVHLVHWQRDSPVERGVADYGHGFVWQERTIDDDALWQAALRIVGNENYLGEICLAARGLINSLASSLEQGALLLIDYGFGAREYYHPQRSSGTLMCHYRHHAHDDPFFMPGLQDITAHVNFTDIAECGIDAGLKLLGYTSQAFFLINCGVIEHLRATTPESTHDYLPLSAQLQKLTSPAEMGELFKVMALGRGLSGALCGFTHGDLTRML